MKDNYKDFFCNATVGNFDLEMRDWENLLTIFQN